MGLEDYCNKKVNKLMEAPALKEYFETGILEVTTKQVIRAISYVSELGVIIYGGALTLPEVLGYEKNLRKPSNDVDALILNPENIKRMNATYIKEFDTALLMINEVPVTISYKHIHDWEVKEWFKKEVIKKDEITYSTPTNTAILKLRRRYQQGKYKGKDYIDIISLIMGEVGINNELLITRVKSEVTQVKSELIRLITPLINYTNQLPKKDKNTAITSINNMIALI